MTEELLLFQSDVKIDIDARSAISAIATLTEKAEAFNAQYRKMMNGIAGIAEDTRNAVNDLVRTTEEAAYTISDLNAALDRYADLTSATREINKYKEFIEELRAENRGYVTEIRQQNERISELEQSFQNLGRQQEDTSDRARKTMQAQGKVLGEYADKIEDLSRRMQRLMRESSGAIKPRVGGFNLVGQAEEAQRAMGQLANDFIDLGHTVEEVYSEIERVITEYGANIAKQQQKDVDAFKQTWLDLKHDLVGEPIVIDMVKEIARWMIDHLGGTLDSAADNVNDMADKMENGFERVKDIFGGPGGAMGAAVEGVKDATGQINDIIDRSTQKLAGSTNETLARFGTNLRKELNYDQQSITDLMSRTEFTMKSAAPGIMDSFRGIGRSIELVKNENIGLVKAFPQLLSSIADAGQATGLMSDNLVGATRRLGDLTRSVGSMFGVIKSGTTDADRSMMMLGKTIEQIGFDLKRQKQVYSRMLEEQERGSQRVIAIYAKREQEANKQIEAIEKEIAKLSEKDTVTKDALQNARQLALEESALNRDIVRYLEDQSDSMKRIWKSNLSEIQNYLNKLADNARHFYTDLEASGTPSVQRIADLRDSIQELNGALQDAGKVGLASFKGFQAGIDLSDESEEFQQLNKETQEFLRGLPELDKWFSRFSDNIGIAGRYVRELSVHERKAKETQDELTSSFARAEKAAGGFGGILERITPSFLKFRKNAEESTEAVQRSTVRMRGGTEEVIEEVGYALGNLDPMFMDVTTGARSMGYAVGSVMNEMREVTSKSSRSMVDNLNLLKLAAAGVVGILTGVVFSATKLAAEVTTLGMTMRVTAKNTGYNVEEMERWVEVLKSTGITTRAATNAITQFMKARLPTTWDDPIAEASYSIKDLARAAQNLAVSMGGDSSETFSRFIYFIQTGNSALLDAIGIAQNASNMYEEYAKSIGKSVKALSTRERYEALLSGLMRESAKVQGVYEEAMKSAAKQMGSMKRYVEELRYEWGKHFEPILAIIIFNFNKLLKILAEIPDKTKETIATFVTIAGSISAVTIALGTLLPKLSGLFAFVKPVLGLFASKFGILAVAIGGIAFALLKMFNVIHVSKPGIEGISQVFQQLIDGVSEFTKKLKPAFDWIDNFFRMIGEHVLQIRIRITVFLKNLRERVDEFLASHPGIAKFLETLKTVAGDMFAVLWRVVDKALTAIEKLLDQDWDGFRKNLMEAGQLIISWILEFFNEIAVQAFEWGKNIIYSFLNGLLREARLAVPRAMTSIGNMIGSFLEGHSPTKLGPLSKIDLWGEGVMAGFARGLFKKRIRFDEDMFTGISSLGAKARIWGDNIVEVFAAGISEKALYAIAPAMNTVGGIIARFLEGHSPPEEGRLASIQDWGKSAFETFLSGFQMADFTILDTGLDLVKQRMETLLSSTENASQKIAAAMARVREAIAGPIAAARASGGPLDLSALKNLFVGSMTVYAQDIAAVLEAMFSAQQAAEAVTALQASIAAARAARQKAIAAAQEVVEQKQKNIERIQEEVEDLEKQMEKEIETRLAMAGLLVDERLLNELKRELDRANEQVSRAQRRLQRIRDAAGAYGVNILTWEEINAQAQLDLAEARRDQVQDTVDYYDEIQRQADALREQIEAEYEARFEALQQELEAAQAAAEAAQERLREMQKADAARTAAENAQLAAAQAYAQKLAEHAALLSKMLEERMKAEEEAMAAIGEGAPTPTEEEATKRTGFDRDERFDWFNLREMGLPSEPPDFSDLFKQYFEGIASGDLGLGEGLNLMFTLIADKIGQKMDEISEWFFTETKVGQLISKFKEGQGVFGFYGTMLEEIGQWINRVIGYWKGWWEIIDDFRQRILGKLKEEFGEIAEKWEEFRERFDRGWEKVKASPVFGFFADLFAGIVQFINDVAQGLADFYDEFLKSGFVKALDGLARVIEFVIELISELIQIFFDLIFSDTEGFVTDIKEIGEAFMNLVDWFTPDTIVDFVKELPAMVENLAADLARTIRKNAKKVIDAFVKIFTDIYDRIFGHSIMPDLFDDIIGLILDFPSRVINAARDLINAFVDIGTDIYDGFIAEVQKIGEDIGGWFSDIGSKITTAKDAVVDKAVEVGSGVYDAISGKFTEIVNSVGGWLTNIGSSISDASRNVSDKASEVAGTVYSAFETKIASITQNIGTWLGNVANTISNSWQTFWDKATSLGQSIYDAVKAKVQEIIDNIGSWFKLGASAMSGENVIEDYIKAAAAIIGAVFTKMYNRIIGDDDSIFNKIGGWIKTVAGALGLTEVVDKFVERGVQLGNAIADGIANAIDWLSGTVGGLIRKMWNLGLQPALQTLMNKVTDGLNAIKNFLESVWNAIPIDIGDWPWPNPIYPPLIPLMQEGGITTRDTLAQLHAGELVLPLEKLNTVLRNLNFDQKPAFAPTMIFQPGADPRQVLPATQNAYDWYTESLRR